MIQDIFLSKVFYISFLVFFGYFLIVTVFYIILAVIGFFEERKRNLQGQTEDYPLLYFSSAASSVSIIMPARNEQEWIKDSVLSILKLNYPKFEVIIVDDGSTDNTLKILEGLLQLEAKDIPYIKHYKDGLVKEILKSRIYPNVTVISKMAGVKKAGALNAGLNIAKNDYVLAIDADTVLERDVLLKVMAHIERDPEHIVGAGSYFGISNGLTIKDGNILNYTFSNNPILVSQNMEYIRSFIGQRIAWSRMNAMPTVAGGFGIWRKDMLYELGGYSTEFTCEDIELTFRAHDYIVKNKSRRYKIIMLPYYSGWTEGPSNIFSLIKQRSRWQRVTNETVYTYKYMLFNPRFGAFGWVVLPYFIFYEVLGSFFEVISVGMVALGAFLHLLDIKIFLAYLFFMIFSQIFVSLLSLLSFVRAKKFFGFNYILYMVILNFLEFLWYRWIISIAKFQGMYSYLKGERTFDQYVRQKRKR